LKESGRLREVADASAEWSSGQPIDPNASVGYCSSWEVAETPVVFECPANKAAGVTFFVVSDSDGDDDVDLFDFAAFQRDFDLP
jgi:hypothetical protein